MSLTFCHFVNFSLKIMVNKENFTQGGSRGRLHNIYKVKILNLCTYINFEHFEQETKCSLMDSVVFKDWISISILASIIFFHLISGTTTSPAQFFTIIYFFKINKCWNSGFIPKKKRVPKNRTPNLKSWIRH